MCYFVKLNELVILYVILLVWVKMKGNIKLVIIYVFYDSGSGGCFLMENFRE